MTPPTELGGATHVGIAGARVPQGLRRVAFRIDADVAQRVPPV